MIRKTLILLLVCGISVTISARDFLHQSGEPLRVQCLQKETAPVVRTALALLGRDVRSVLGDTVVEVTSRPELLLDINPRYFASRNLPQFEAFHIEINKGQMRITGSDEHGLAYGILEVSRLLGVSPWEWWADAIPAPRRQFEVSADYRTTQSPSVQYRGIFINDEDWGLMPWSGETYEPENGRGVIGPRTNARIFELLLRLRANYFWPAMHECTQPFFLTPGNREVAEQYGIYIGGSHCEPMASSTAGEWRRRGQGDYDYVHNETSVVRFWEERLCEVKQQPIVYTLGMRGVHDGKMQGAKSLSEQREVLQRVIGKQRELLARYVDPDVTRIPQVFIPYKEVLDIYQSGLQVPEDVCLMWCDDNYGYITHFPTETERKRSGGNGLYYHVSYWGRPHDYLWLGAFYPKLLMQQLRQAYDRGIQRMWILNVGDLKPLEYQTELFMDMAWDIERVCAEGCSSHLLQFYSREFGTAGNSISSVMEQYYDLNFDCKPEFLGHTRTEEKDPKFKIVEDMPWTQKFIHNRLLAFDSLSAQVEAVGVHAIPDQKQESYFQLVKYPVQAAAQMNRKMLIGQLARHQKADWTWSDAAYDSIRILTDMYNKGVRGQGKWNRIMDFQPRRLPVFQPLAHRLDSVPMLEDDSLYFSWHPQGKLWQELSGEMSFGPIEIPAGTDSICVEISMLPTHPVNNQTLRYECTFDGQATQVFSIRTQGRTEEWKQNVLSNRSLRKTLYKVDPNAPHTLTLKPLDEGVFLRKIVVKKVK